MTDTASRAEEIAGEGKYEEIVEKLRGSGAFSSRIETMRNAYGARLNLDHFTPTDRDWEMLAVLGLYDASTMEHSIRTFELSYYLITHPFAQTSGVDHGGTIILGDFLWRAGVSREQFLRAALFHDIGKVIIPREILRNTLDDEEVLVKMFPAEHLAEERERKAALETLYASGIRPIDVVPLKEIFTGEKYTELLCDLEKRGFHDMATLKDVIRMHEPESKRILTAAGFETEGELAGRHHNYEKEDHRRTVSLPGMAFGIADLIRIADVTDALCSGRWYKKPLSPLDVLFVLAKDAEAGKINASLAQVWINDRYVALQTSMGGVSLTSDGDVNNEEMFAVETFLGKETRFA